MAVMCQPSCSCQAQPESASLLTAEPMSSENRSVSANTVSQQVSAVLLRFALCFVWNAQAAD